MSEAFFKFSFINEIDFKDLLKRYEARRVHCEKRSPQINIRPECVRFMKFLAEEFELRIEVLHLGVYIMDIFM